MFQLVLAVAWLAVAPPAAVTDLDGRPVDALAPAAGVRATVLVFTRTDCPIANQAAPEIERIRTAFAARGVRMFLVFVDPDEPAAAIRAHLAEYALTAPALLDPAHVLVRLAGVRVTPEAAVFLHDQAPARPGYRGRLNNLYSDFGRRRPAPTRHDLREAIESALAGRLAALQTTPAVGCEIADLR